MQLEAGQTLLHYRLVEKIGEGGMGVVWKALDTRLGREVAIKLLPEAFATDPERLGRFEREARVLAALNHPGIVTIHAVERVEERPFLVMEHVRGRPLSKLIRPGGLSPERFFGLAIPLAEAVAAAHREGITHRDLKPANVLIGDDGRLKVLDFGLAKLVAAEPGGDLIETATREASTGTGVVLGTVAYMSPEQAEGKPADARSDIFSLGVVLHEMATGGRPFGGESPAQVVSALLRDEPPAIEEARTDLPALLGRIVRRCLEKDPERRFQSALDIRNELETLREETRRDSPPTRRREGRGRVAVGVLALFAVLVGGAVWLTRDRRPGREAGDVPGGELPRVAHRLTQVTAGAEVEQWSEWSPDGRRLVYCVEREGFSRLILKDLDSGEDRALTAGGRDEIQPAWSPDGTTLAFVRASAASGDLDPSEALSGIYDGGDVWLLDLASGRETRIVEEAFSPEFSPDGDRLVVEASWAGPRRLWITDARGHNPRQVTTDTSEAVSHSRPSWSPDGAHLVYQHQEKTRLDIRVVEVATGETLSVTDDLYLDLDPRWSPSGEHIYFASYRGGGLNIWRARVDPAGRPSGPPAQLTTGAGQDIQPALAPDGSRLAFTVLSQNADLWRLALDPATGAAEGVPEPLVASTREDSRGAWSPDGRLLAFNSDRDGEMNIWLHSLADGSARALTRGPGGDYQPGWSPDGREIMFFSSRSGNADVWVVEVATGELRQVTDDPALDTNPFFSPDGRTIAFQSDRDGRKEVWLVEVGGSNPRPLTTVGATDHFLRWSGDGKHVFFRSQTLPENGVCRVPAAGGEAEPLGIPAGWHMSFSPDRSLLLDVVGHKVLWVFPLDGSPRRRVFESDDPGLRIDYPEWSPDGTSVVFDRVSPRGGDVWLLEGLT